MNNHLSISSLLEAIPSQVYLKPIEKVLVPKAKDNSRLQMYRRKKQGSVLNSQRATKKHFDIHGQTVSLQRNASALSNDSLELFQ